jgi:hypothetical protein
LSDKHDLIKVVKEEAVDLRQKVDLLREKLKKYKGGILQVKL